MKKQRKAPKLDQLQSTAMYVAMVVRNAMEDFHAAHLSDKQMAELNPIIRNAIYTALFGLEQFDQQVPGSHIWMEFNSKWPDYWEPPKLLKSYTDAMREVRGLDSGSVALLQRLLHTGRSTRE